MTVIHRVL